MSVLIANNLTKVYGENKGNYSTKALDGVDLHVEEGEFIAIMGPSGSGKSTLVSILSGITLPTSGSVEICGNRIDKLDQYEMALFRRRKLGFVFQEFNLLDNLTLKENVMLPMVLDKKDSNYMDEKSMEIMKLFGIEEIGEGVSFTSLICYLILINVDLSVILIIQYYLFYCFKSIIFNLIFN